MIYLQEKTIKVAGKYIPGQVTNISISEAGTLDEKKKKKGGVAAVNPKGYDSPQIQIQIIFEESSTYDAVNMVRFVQRIFKSASQKKPKKFKIYESQINARGVTEVYFAGFDTAQEIGKSYYTGTLTFKGATISAIKVVKTKAQIKKEEAAKKKSAAKKTTKKKTSKSPAKDTRNKSSAKKKAKKVIKK